MIKMEELEFYLLLQVFVLHVFSRHLSMCHELRTAVKTAKNEDL